MPKVQGTRLPAKCQVCLRRSGLATHLDEDFIGLLCDRCHFALVQLLRLLVEGARSLRQVDRQKVAQIVKAALVFGAGGGR